MFTYYGSAGAKSRTVTMTHTKCNCFIPYNGDQEKDEEKKENLIY